MEMLWRLLDPVVRGLKWCDQCQVYFDESRPNDHTYCGYRWR